MNYRETECADCEGSGMVMGEYFHKKSGEIRWGAWQCCCPLGKFKLPGAPVATDEVIRAARDRYIAEQQRIRDWYAGLGCDFDNDPEDVLMDAARKELRRMMDAAGGIFRKQKSGIVGH